jgi:hypothetical protein
VAEDVGEEVEEETLCPEEMVTIASAVDSLFSDSSPCSLSSVQQTIQLHNYSTTLSPGDTGNKGKVTGKSCSPTSSASSSPNARKSGGGRGTSRGRPITDLVLTDEEKRLLKKEGYHDFPEGTIPLTKQEEKILRKIRRKIRNKRSAQCSRQRKKEYVDDLEKKYDNCAHENEQLKKECQKLRKENEGLMVKMKKLLLMSGTGPNGQASFKTSFFVLVLSFLLILIPCFRPDVVEDNMMGLSGDQDMIKTGRHLLMALSSNEVDTGAGTGYYYGWSAINESETLVNVSTSVPY